MSASRVKPDVLHRNSGKMNGRSLPWEGSGMGDVGGPNFLQGHSVPRCHQPCYPPSIHCERMAEKQGFPTGMHREQTFCGTAACRACLTRSPLGNQARGGDVDKGLGKLTLQKKRTYACISNSQLGKGQFPQGPLSMHG